MQPTRGYLAAEHHPDSSASWQLSNSEVTADVLRRRTFSPPTGADF
jgi:hypothetical protein